MKIFILIEGKPFVSFIPFPLCSHYVISLVDAWLPSWLIGWPAALQSNHHCVTGRHAEWITVKVTDWLVCWLWLAQLLSLMCLCIANWVKGWGWRPIFFWSSICLINDCVFVCLSILSDFHSCPLLSAPNQHVPTEHVILFKMGNRYIFSCLEKGK